MRGFLRSNAAAVSLFLVALALRLAHYAEIRHTPLFLSPVLDSRFYSQWAQQIAAGSGLGDAVFVLNPGYAYFLAVLFKLFRPGGDAPVLVQCCIGAASCLLVHRIGLRVFGSRTALVAGALAAFYPASILYDGLLVTAGLIVFLNLLAIVGLLELRRPRQMVLPGVALGLSALLRPTVLAFLPLAVLWLLRRGRRGAAASLAAACVAVLLPVLARNYAVGHQVTLATAGVGMNLYIGNHTGADGTYAPQPFESGDPQLQAEEYRQEASRLSGRTLTAGESSSFWRRRATAFAAGEPRAFAALLVRKAALFFNKAEVPTNMDLSYLQDRSFLRFLPFLSFGVLCPVALLGMALARGDGARLLQLYVLAYLVANVLFFVGSEYRFPVVPALFLFAASAVCTLASIRSAQGALAAAAALALLGFACNVTLFRNDEAVMHSNLGNAYLRQGFQAEAVAEYRRALEIDPASAPARANLASVYFNRGDYPQAIAEYERVVQANPWFAYAWYSLGLCYHNLGRYPEAVPRFKRALELKPDWKLARDFYLQDSARLP